MRLIDAHEIATWKRSKWLKKKVTIREDGLQITGTYPVCENCGCVETGFKQGTRYCPDCGAYMEGTDA